MALSQDTVKEIFVVDALASQTTLKTFKDSASDGEIGVFNADGSDGDTEGKFLIAAKIAGSVITSDLYAPEDIKRIYQVGGVAQTYKTVRVTPTDTTVGTEYVLEIRVQNFGSLSPVNFYSKFAHYVVKTGDAVADIIDGLVISLNKNFSKEPGATLTSNPYFTFTDNATSLDITEKDQPLDLGKDEGRPLVFDVIVKRYDSEDIATTAIQSAGSPGVATGKQVALMEYFYRGNRGDQYRKQHFPYNWNLKTKSEADPSAQYSLIEALAIKKQDEMFNVATARKAFVIAVPDGAATDEYTVLNAITAKLEAVTGKTFAKLVNTI